MNSLSFITTSTIKYITSRRNGAAFCCKDNHVTVYGLRCVEIRCIVLESPACKSYSAGGGVKRAAQAQRSATKPTETDATAPQPTILHPVHQLGELHLCLVSSSNSRLGPSGVQSVPVKDIFLYPLTRNFKTVLKNGACQ